MAAARKTKRGKMMANPNPHHIKKSILNRVGWLYFIFFSLAVAIFLQIILTQFGPNGEPLRNLSESKCYRLSNIYASRGNILSDDGRILATDAPFYNIRLDFGVPTLTDELFNENVGSLADSLSELLGNSKSYYLTRLKSIRSRAKSGGRGHRDQLLVNRVNQIELDRIKQFPLFNTGKSGLMCPKDTVRYLPFGTLASYTIGKPASHGIEHSYNEVLKGTNGKNLYVKLVGNVWLPVIDPVNEEVQNGRDVVTTINIDLQDVAENALRTQMADKNALSGTAIVMEVETGKIKAISNLTHNRDGSLVDNFNYATNSRNEPGSTFKLVSLLALLEQCGLSIDDTVDCGATGSEVVNGSLITDTHHIGEVTIKEMMAQSSNVGFAKSIDKQYRSKPEAFVKFINDLGINRQANIQQQRGLGAVIKDPALGSKNDWNRMTLTKMAYGYALELTPMHTLMLYNAVANGGKMISPILVSEIRDGKTTVEKFEAETINSKICSDKTLKEVRECLQEVVAHGTAGVLKNDYYTVAGKTGTAQVAQQRGGYRTADGGMDYLATLVGYFPAENPKYSCIVAITTHRAPGDYKSIYYGASLAGPVFKAITDRIYTLDKEWRPEVVSRSITLDSIEVKGGNVEEIFKAAEKLGLKNSIRGRDTGWARVKLDSVMHINPLEEKEGMMPSVMGLGMKDAVYMLESRGLRVETSGKGRVVEQSIKAGSGYLKGETVYIRLNY